MQKILLVEDAAFFEKAALKKLAEIGERRITVARTLAQAEAQLTGGGEAFELALVDLTLPDAPDGQIVDLCISHRVPTVVFTSRFEPHLRKAMRDKGVLDYIIKDSPSSLDYLGDLVQRLGRNSSIGVLVIDDAVVERTYMSETIARHRYKMFVASSAKEGMQYLQDYPEIRLVIVDYFMPEEDGFSFLKAIRRKRSRESLAVIGISGSEDMENRIRFLKYGASDFLHKSCPPEELLLRVSQNLDVIDRFADLSDRSFRDALTGLYNRRFLFSEGIRLVSEAQERGEVRWLALVDVDKFKHVNDTYGHEAGDRALIALSDELLRLSGEEGQAVRLGGDEFCAVLCGKSEAEVMTRVEAFRCRLQSLDISSGEQTFRIAASIGLSVIPGHDLSEAIRTSDARLYSAKDSGRNQLVAS
ncbi:diguanylate cyclase [Pannonibacter phragmitetus]|uniref:diguanylate cyclase n=1 Tax=Pannonibacter phragmitetus TaxID=121719 RepID=UPI000F458094|nr:diguanylate cyclase [Pannonibacter phragmitetus]MBA4205079.1 diguanylate cyclase response regulator [Polymorphum sp.]